MELKHLQYFTEVVKQGSFSKAAEYLYISQPNISNVIKNLEEELDVKRCCYIYGNAPYSGITLDSIC